MSTPAAGESTCKIGRLLGITAGLALAGLVLALGLQLNPRAEPTPPLSNVFFALFARTEPLGTALAFVFILFVVVAHQKGWFDRGGKWDLPLQVERQGAIYAVGAGVLLVCALGRFIVMHRFPLAMDEYASEFQAQIFLSGHTKAVLPEAWAPFGNALAPFFIAYDPATHAWHSTYLPVYAAFRAVFLAFGIADLTNAVFSMGSVLAVAAVARKIWPDTKQAPLAAALLLASAAVFLVTGMTSYAMPAHLCLNLVWLWLYLSPERKRFWLAPFVGVLALGLHQPFFHALFATPFLLRLVLQRRWRAVFGYAIVYLAGVVCWYLWWQAHNPTFERSSTGVFRFWDEGSLLREGMSFTLLFTWQNAAVLLFCLAAIPRLRTMPTAVKDAAWGLALTGAFYSFIAFSQGHGWGNRYLFNVLGNLVLLGVAGFLVLCQHWGKERTSRLLIASACFALLVQFPVRCFQAEGFVRPFAKGMEFVRKQKAAIVLIDHIEAWYSSDLVRNEPFLDNTPKIMLLRRLSGDQVDELSKLSSVRFVRGRELAAVGMIPTHPLILEKLFRRKNAPAEQVLPNGRDTEEVLK